MKEILSTQCDVVSGGWADKDGSGHRSADNGGSRSGGNSGTSSLDRAVAAYHNSPYGSGASANGFFGGTNGIGSTGSKSDGRPHTGTDR